MNIYIMRFDRSKEKKLWFMKRPRFYALHIGDWIICLALDLNWTWTIMRGDYKKEFSTKSQGSKEDG